MNLSKNKPRYKMSFYFTDAYEYVANFNEASKRFMGTYHFIDITENISA